MQYALLVYQSEQWPSLSKVEKNRVHDDCTAWHQELVKSGHTRGGLGLHAVSTATTVREKNGRAVMTDGPFAETKEVLGGFELIECKDLNEAVAIAGRFPALRVGFAVEVRPVMTGGCSED